MIDREALQKWIQPQHLDDAAIEADRRAFESHPSRLCVLRDFLVDDIASKLSRFLLEEAEFKREFGIYSVEGAVSEEAYEAADETDRFFRLSRLADIPSQHRFSPNALTYLKLRQTFQRPEFEAFFESMTGLSLGSSDDFGVHSMKTGDYLRAHSDDNKRRRLALVIYLSPAWKPEFGGSLQMIDGDGNQTTVDAEYNSIVLFDVLAGTSHHVARVEQAAGGAPRVTIGGWYHQAG